MEAAEKVKKLTGKKCFDVAVVGGSGIDLGKAEVEIPYSEIPGMPEPAVPGHRGHLKVFTVSGKSLLFFEGRFHYYEGREDWEIRFIPQLSASLGVKVFIPTCASGAVSRRAVESEIGVIYDHINLLGRNPLVGLIKEYGSRVFVNGKKFYDRSLVETFIRAGLNEGVKVIPSVLAATLGPNYETFSEVRMLELLGADCVSMSTVPDVIAANFYGMKVVALTIFTNDTLQVEASHHDVLKLSKERGEKLKTVLLEGIKQVKL